MAGFVELCRSAEPCGTGPNHGDFLAGALGRRLRNDPALLEAALNDGILDILNGDRRGVDSQNAGALTGGGTNASGKVREIVRLVQTLQRFMPEAAIDEIVPLRNQVVDRAARRLTVD